MINAVIAIELEAYLEHNGQIEAVHDRGKLVDGYALYLRYENERGDALAQWLCDHPDHRWLTQLGTLLASDQLPRPVARLHPCGLPRPSQSCNHHIYQPIIQAPRLPSHVQRGGAIHSHL